MLKLIAATAFLGTLALGSAAFAENGNGSNQGLRQLSWEQLQQACQNPAAFQSQRQPNAIRLTCEDTQLVWEADQSDSVEMDNQRQILASLSSDKYYVTQQQASVPMSVSTTSCPRFREVEVKFSQSFSLSCQEIQSFKGNMANFCQGRIDSALNANKSLATRTPTGRSYDMCAAPELIPGGKGQPGTGQPGAGQSGGQPSAQPGGSKQPAQPGISRPAVPVGGAGSQAGSKGR